MEEKERRAIQRADTGKQWATPLPRQILHLRENAFSLFVTNISEDMSKTELEAMFWSAGKILDAFIPIDKLSGKKRGFTFVRFGTLKEAENAVQLARGRSWGEKNSSSVGQI